MTRTTTSGWKGNVEDLPETKWKIYTPPMARAVLARQALAAEAGVALVIRHESGRTGRTIGTVTRYRNDMRGGLWDETACAPLAFTKPILLPGDSEPMPVLAEGGQRMAALAGIEDNDFGIPFKETVGISDSAIENIDSGRPRTLSMQLQAHKIANSSQLSSPLHTRWSHLNGRFETRIKQHRIELVPVSDRQLVELYRTDPEAFQESVRAAQRVARSTAAKNTSRGAVGAAFLAFRDVDPEQVDVYDFFDQLCKGEGLFEGDPTYELRRAMTQATKTRRANATLIGQNRYWLAIFIKAWNAYRAGEKLDGIKFAPGGARPEQFPKAI